MFEEKYTRSKFWIHSIILFSLTWVSLAFFKASGVIETSIYQTNSPVFSIFLLLPTLIQFYILANRIRDYGGNPYLVFLGIIPLFTIFQVFYYGILKSKNNIQSSEVNTTDNTSSNQNHIDNKINKDAAVDIDKEVNIKSNIHEDSLYEEAMEELEKGTKHKGVWAKAYANSEGDKGKAEALYIKYRVVSIQQNNEEKKAARLQIEKHRLQIKEEKKKKKKNEERDIKLLFLREQKLFMVKNISDTECIVGAHNSPMEGIAKYINGEWKVIKWY